MQQPELRADPVDLTRAADQLLRSSQAIGDNWRLAQGPLAVPLAAFGNCNGGSEVHTAVQAATSDADVAIGRLVAVLEGDMDRLYRIAFAYQEADEQAAHSIARGQLPAN